MTRASSMFVAWRRSLWRLRVAGVFVVVAWRIGFGSAIAAERRDENAAPIVVSQAARLNDRQLAAAIDDYYSRRWSTAGVKPVEPASDAEWVRRVYLDFAGKIPPASAARAFLDNPSSSKRAELVDALLAEGAYVRHFAGWWTAILLAGASDDAQTRAPRLETWLRLRLASNLGWDQIAAELLTAAVENPTRVVAQSIDPAVADPGAFFLASDRKPEQLAANTSRVFLGLQVQCAQCHDHPHAHWKRHEFWSFAGLFTEYAAGAGEAADVASGLRIPDTEQIAPVEFLDGTSPAATAPSRRAALARWLTASDNRWFAQATVNRVWEHLLGRGLVDPVDDLEAVDADDHVELLALVAEQFRLSGYDLEYLLRTIAATRLYGLSSRRDPSHPLPRHLFARMPLRKMSADQLFDSLAQATGLREPRVNRAAPAGDSESARGAFRLSFSDPAVATDAETSILQALALMNGKLVADATDLQKGETLAAVGAATFLDTSAKIDTLFLATLSRFPTTAERSQCLSYVGDANAPRERSAALADLVWALVNSAEFGVIH